MDQLTLDREISDIIDKLESLLVLAYQDEKLTHNQQMNIAENLDILATEFSDIVHESFETMDDERKEFWGIPPLYNASVIIDGALDDEEQFYTLDEAVQWLDEQQVALELDKARDIAKGEPTFSEALLAVFDSFECQNVYTLEVH